MSTGSAHPATEFIVPERPRLPSELVVLPYGLNGLLFHGARGTQVLDVRGTRSLVPRLIPQLDGRRSLAELTEAMAPCPAAAVHEAIALLHSRGLLEDGESPPVEAELAHVASYCARYTDATRANRNRHEALQRLSLARAAIVGSPRAMQALRTALSGLGLRGVRMLAEPGELNELDASTDLVVAVFEATDVAAPAWLDAAWQRGLRVLHAHVGASRVEVGPLLVPGRSGCHHCLRELRPREADTHAQDVGFWCGVVALQAFHVLSRIGTPPLYNVCHVHRRTRHGSIYEEVRYGRLPGCQRCGLGHHSPRHGEHTRLTWLLHNAANGLPPRDLLSPRDDQALHPVAPDKRLDPPPPEPLHHAEVVPLPVGIELSIAPAWTGGVRTHAVLDLPTLATLLRHAVGHGTDTTQRRLAPSTGGLGCAQMFVVVRRLDGLEPGVYHYDAFTHQLGRLRATRDDTLAGALGVVDTELPPVLLVGTACLAKLREHYQDGAFRLAHLDAGVARAYLDDMLRALGIGYREMTDARDKAVAEAISLSTMGTRNLVTYVIGVGQPTGAVDLSMLVPHQYVDALVALSSQRPAWQAPPPQPRARVAHALMPASLGEIMQARRSTRHFAPGPIQLQTVQQIVEIASGADDALATAGALPVNMTLWVALNPGVDPRMDHTGLYRWDACARALLRLRCTVAPQEVLDTLQQPALARAPAVLYITGDFGDAVDTHGARGLRELFSRAGAIAARALLAAQAVRLAACAWGGVLEDGWGRLLGIDRYSDCPLFGVSLGHARDDTAGACVRSVSAGA